MTYAVAGLTKNIAACGRGRSPGTGTQRLTGTTLTSAQFPPVAESAATRRPFNNRPSSPPSPSTIPTPSYPGTAGGSTGD